MSTLSVLNTNKYSEYETRIASKRRRLIELSEDDMVRINHQMAQWLLGAVSGNAALMASALAELKELYDDSTIAAPTNLIGSTLTENNTQRGVAVSITAGSQTIPFSSAMSTTAYSLVLFAYTSTGGMIQISSDPTLRTVNGFQLTAASAGKLDFIALEN
jgi:hypothetical protein